MLERFKKCLSLEEHYTHVDNDASFYVERDGKTLNIYFEWSNGATDWFHNFDFPAKPYRDMENLWFCHRGFLKVWKSIEPYLKDYVENPFITEFNIVGYSHGGAIAQLCHEYIRFNRPYVSVNGIGFGAPRVVWGFPRKAVRERFKGFVVVRNGKDVITKLPPVIFGFRHVCEIAQIGTGTKGPIDDHRPENYIESLSES